VAEERSFLQKLLKPTEEEKRNIIEQIEEGRKYARILDEEGFRSLVTRIAEQEALDQGQTEEEVLENRKKVDQFLKTNKSIINKFIPSGKEDEIESNKSFFGSAKAAEPDEIPEIKNTTQRKLRAKLRRSKSIPEANIYSMLIMKHELEESGEL